MDVKMAKDIAIMNQDTMYDIRSIASGMGNALLETGSDAERLEVIKHLICKAENYNQQVISYLKFE